MFQTPLDLMLPSTLTAFSQRKRLMLSTVGVVCFFWIAAIYCHLISICIVQDQVEEPTLFKSFILCNI